MYRFTIRDVLWLTVVVALLIVWQRDKHARDAQLDNRRCLVNQTIGDKYNENDRSSIELHIQLFQRDWQRKP
jgi:hypothetical protein